MSPACTVAGSTCATPDAEIVTWTTSAPAGIGVRPWTMPVSSTASTATKMAAGSAVRQPITAAATMAATP